MTTQPESDASGSTYPRRLDAPAIDTADKLPDQWLIAALEEYRSLRVEIVDAIEAQRKIMQLGLTGLSVLIGLGLQQISPLFTVVLFMLLAPTVAIFITAGALGERFRASRASYFLACKEQIVNQVLAGSHPALEWEKWLRDRPVFILRDRAEFLAIFSLTTGALGLGFYTLFATPTLHFLQPVLAILLGIISLVLWITCAVLHLYLIEESRREFLSGGQTPPSTLVTILRGLRIRRSGRW